MNTLIVDENVRDYQVFVTSVNSSTTPLVFRGTLEIPAVDRVGFVFEQGSVMGTLLRESIDQLISSGVKQMDFLACDTLSIPEWKSFYATLMDAGIRVGASNNLTGNIQYGGDWIMESSCEDIESVYFTNSIEYYKYLLGNNFATMVIDNEGWVWACGPGYNTADTINQMGLGGVEASYLTRTNMSNALAVSACYSITLALSRDGWVYSCGNTGCYARTGPNNIFGRTNLSNATEISAGESTTYAIANGTLYKGTSNSFQSMNVSADKISSFISTVYLRNGNLYNTGHGLIATDVKEVSVGRSITMYVKSNGDLYDTSQGKIPNMSNVTAIGSGMDHYLALVGGQLYGKGTLDLFGYGTRSTFTPIPNMTNVTQISAGERHSMALINGRVFTAGYYALNSPTEPGKQLGRYGNNLSFMPAQKIVGGVISEMTNVTGLLENKAVNTTFSVTSITLSGTTNTPIVVSGNLLHEVSVTMDNIPVSINTSTFSGFSFPAPIGTNNVSIIVTHATGVYGSTFSYENPTVTTIVPNSAIQRSIVQLNGTFLSNSDYVVFGNISTRSFTATPNTLNVSVPVSNQTNVSVRIYDKYQNVFDYTSPFTFLEPFTVTTFEPATAVPQSTLTLRGSNFSNMSYATFGSVIARTTFLSNTELIVSVPSNVSDNVPLTLYDVYGNNASYSSRVRTIPILTATVATPSKGIPGMTISLNGANFSNIARIMVGNVSLQPLTVNSSVITIRMPNLSTQPFAIPITVYDTFGNNTTFANFSYVPPLTVNTFQAVVRNAPIFLYGTNFANLSSVQFGDIFVHDLSYNNNLVTVKLPAIQDNVSVRIHDLYGNSAEYASRIKPLPYLKTTTYVPPSLIPNTSLLLKGTNFSNISTVRIGNTFVTPLYNSSVSLTVTVPPTLVNNTITVYDVYGNNDTYKPPIQLVGLSSYTGYKNMILKMYGDNFTNIKRVWFNQVSTEVFYRISNTEYSVIVPGSITGPVVVEDIFGIVSTSITFVYQTPIVSSLSANSGKKGDTLVLLGQSLSNTDAVYFGNIPSKVISATSSNITVQVPVGVGVVPLRIYDKVRNQAICSLTFEHQIQSKPVGKVQAIVKSSTSNASQKYYSLLEGSNYSIAKYVNASTYNRLFNSSNPIAGITFSNNMIYFCDPSANAIRAIPANGGAATTVFTRGTMIPEAVKTNGSTLFIACRNTGVASNDAILTANLSGTILSTQPYSTMPGYTLKGITYKNQDIYTSAVLYPTATTAMGRVFKTNTSTNLSFIQGLTNPLDLTFSNGYLVVDGRIQIYNPNGVLVATYETDANTVTEEITVGETQISFTVNNESTATSEISQIVIPPNTGDTFQLTDQYSPVKGSEGTIVSIIGYNMTSDDILSVDVSGTTVIPLVSNQTYFVTTNLLVLRMPETIDLDVTIRVTLTSGIQSYVFTYGQPDLTNIIPLYRGDQRYFHFTGRNLENIQAVEFVDQTVTELSSAKTFVRDVTSTSFNCDLPNVPMNTARCLLQDIFGKVYQEDANYFSLLSETCFLAGTPILTDQGHVAIDKIDCAYHTLGKKKILAITKVKYNASTLILFEKDSIRKHYPTRDTVMSRKHKLYVKGKMKTAESVKGGIEIPYRNEYLYNVLLETHETMNVNGLICETLYPKNPIASYFLSSSIVHCIRKTVE